MNLKKLLALLMAVVMVFALAACGNGAESDSDDDDKKSSSSSKDEDGVEGKWKATYTADAEMLGLKGYDVSLNMYFELTIEGDTFEMGLSADKMRDSYMDFTEDVAIITWEEMIADYDSEEEAETALSMTREEFVQAVIDEVDVDAALEEIAATVEGTVELDGDKITLTHDDEDEDPAEGTWDGNTITLENDLNGESMELVFERA